jgi:hypothetical protein
MPIGTSDDCDAAGTNVITGYLGATYVKLRTAPGGPNVTLVCVAAENGTTHLGGKVAVNGTPPGAPTAVDQDAASVEACDLNANNTDVQSGTVLGGQPYWIDVTAQPAGSTDLAWVCVRFTNTVGFRLRFSTGGAGAGTGFVADPPTPRNYADAPWPVAGPSALCQTGLGGTKTRDVNLTVGTTHLALYRWAENASRSHLCFRAGATGGAGGRLSLDTAASPGVSPVFISTNSITPCPFDVVTRTEPPPTYGVYISDPEALPTPPVSACVAVTTTAVGVSLGASGPATASWNPDPA